MKALHIPCLATAALLLGLASCASDEPINNNQNGDGNVTFTLNVPDQLSTRTFGDGTKALDLYYAVYESGSTTPVITSLAETHFVGLTATVNLKLVNGKTYDIIWWAQSPLVSCYTFKPDAQTVSIDYTGVLGNDENRDAFFQQTTGVNVTGAINETVRLYRPFAQINLGTNDLQTPAVAPLKPNLKTSLATKAYSTLNLLTGAVTDETNVTYGFNNPPAGETFPVAGYEYLSMDYLLVPADKTLVDCTFSIADGGANNKILNTITVPSTPVQRNYRTNIYGQMLTSNAEYTVVIEPMFDGEYDIQIPRWDGTTTTPAEDLGLNNPATTDVHLKTPADFAGFAAFVNAGNSLSGKTIHLDNDIDLSNQEWTPVGNAEHAFDGAFDAHGKTIHNLLITKAQAFSGLFGHTTGSGLIQNLTINNVHITNTYTDSNSGTGAVAGNPFTKSFQNITVTGEIQVEAFRYVGAAFGHSVYGNLTDITIDASPESYVKATNTYDGFLSAPNHCGGVMGYPGEGNSVYKNLTSNINVISATAGVGGISGTAMYGNTFINCVCTGNVTLQNASTEKSVLAIGGIAGINVPGDNQTITFTGCSFTGTLTANLNGKPFTLPQRNLTVGTTYGGRSAGYGISGEKIVIN